MTDIIARRKKEARRRQHTHRRQNSNCVYSRTVQGLLGRGGDAHVKNAYWRVFSAIASQTRQFCVLCRRPREKQHRSIDKQTYGLFSSLYLFFELLSLSWKFDGGYTKERNPPWPYA